ncbi:hypothetical protein PLIIFM63780_007446 [Purpureocillium lilacinum]|nr:hypothetical protein PLIIFM63780_007446 [Purpureocillium lilacinum]
MAGPQESKLNTNHDITYSHGARFKCKMGGEWLPITEFSRNQRKLIDHQVGRGGRVDTANSGMICRHHTTSTVREIRCELCQLIKPENEFSTNSKKSGDNLCRRCVAWGETQEPEVTPFALETGHISVEEDVKKPGDRRYWDEADFFVGAKPQAPMEDLEGLGLEHLSLDQLEKARSAISHNTAGGRGEASGAGTPAHTSSTVDQSSVANDTSEFEDDGWQVASGGRGNRGRNNWHKAPRMPQAELGTQTRLTHISARCDDPVAEAKRRAEYCHSDDSDY